MFDPIECAGAPRDLGFDQGAACRGLLAREYAATSGLDRLRWRAGRADVDSARMARDVARHFPRHAEAQEGLARGAGVPAPWLERLLFRAQAHPARFGAAVGLAAAPGGAARIARARPADAILRRARPDGGFACLELAPPWFAGALAAVSEAGLAAAAVPQSASDAVSGCAAPAALLVQDALHRTGSLAAALDWCLRRPAGGRATLLFADADGETAGLVVAGDERRVLRPADGLVAVAGGRESEIAKALAEGAAIGAGQLAAALAAPAVILDPAARRVALADASGSEEWIALS